jgi:methionyl aminopeptidase
MIIKTMNLLLLASRMTVSSCSAARGWSKQVAFAPTTTTLQRGLATGSSSKKSFTKIAAMNARSYDQRFAMERREKFPPTRSAPVRAFPLSPYKPVPPQIARPPYADSGQVPHDPLTSDQVLLHDIESIDRMRGAARLAHDVLMLACSMAKPGISTDEIDTEVHNAIVDAGGYPSPLNYAGFPKSLCSSVNEVICHGIPDGRPLQEGDVVSFDVSCFINGVHGDNCATVIVGDEQDFISEAGVDWRGIPYRNQFESPEQELKFLNARRLVTATRESLYAAISTCGPGSCLSEIGNAIQEVADAYGYSTVEKYRGHGIGEEFHRPPFVKVSSYHI